jgi:predicted RNA-binding protein (TIGR00451 family)
MKRHALRNKEIKALGLPVKSRVEVIEENEAKLYYADGKLVKAKKDDTVFPTLNSDLSALKSVVVDMGAVSHIANGADVMAPGIVRHDSLREGELAVIRDERHGKALAVGIVIAPLSEKGKVIKTLHYVGDAIWERRELS